MFTKNEGKLIKCAVATLVLLVMIVTPAVAATNEMSPSRETEICFEPPTVEATLPTPAPRVGRVHVCVTRVHADSALRVRSGPGTEYRIVGTLAPNSMAWHPSIQPTPPAGWRNITGPIAGWVYDYFLGPHDADGYCPIWTG